MKRHLIALDLDGTLLNDNKEISKRTLETIKKLRDNGHIVVIATGRPHRVSKQYYAQMELNTPMVNMNGAYIHHPLDHSWDHMHSPLPQKVAYEIAETCYEVGVQNIMAEIIDEVYLEKKHEHIFTNFLLAGLERPAIIGQITETLKGDPSSMLIHPHDNRVDVIRNSLDERHAQIVDHRKWGAPFHVIEIVRSGLHKAVGLQKIAKEYDIPKERIIAFGDEDNDFEMIDYAGIGVAMGNGISPLKSLANEITLTNEEDGVAHFLELYFNMKTPILTKE